MRKPKAVWIDNLSLLMVFMIFGALLLLNIHPFPWIVPLEAHGAFGYGMSDFLVVVLWLLSILISFAALFLSYRFVEKGDTKGVRLAYATTILIAIITMFVVGQTLLVPLKNNWITKYLFWFMSVYHAFLFIVMICSLILGIRANPRGNVREEKKERRYLLRAGICGIGLVVSIVLIMALSIPFRLKEIKQFEIIMPAFSVVRENDDGIVHGMNSRVKLPSDVALCIRPSQLLSLETFVDWRYRISIKTLDDDKAVYFKQGFCSELLLDKASLNYLILPYFHPKQYYKILMFVITPEELPEEMFEFRVSLFSYDDYARYLLHKNFNEHDS